MQKNNKNGSRILIGLLVVVLFASLAVWVACQRDLPTQANLSGQDSPDAMTSLSKAHPDVMNVIKIQNRHTGRLLQEPGIVGTATGLDDNGRLVVKVFTTEKGIAKLPADLDGIPVKEEVTGKFVIYSDPTSRFSRPVPIGVSSGHPDITAGTIGCRVKDAQGNVYALSNNHVYANINNASIGDNELQPGAYDGGQDPADAIGTLYDYEPIKFDGSNNYIDAAIASTSTSLVGYATPSDLGYGTPGTTTKSASIGQKVQKCGRTTGYTHGEVAEINVTVDVCYESRGPFKCVKLARFVEQIGITPGTFSDGGDSGSLIVTDDNNKNPVGLLFAGSDTRTLANPINQVLQRFNVTIDDGSGGSQNLAPTADFTYTTTDLTASFTDQSTDSDGSIVGWSWNFGDGATSTAQNPTHTYAAAGTYTVSLTVTDDDGATDATSKSVTVSSSTTNNPPTADFTYATTDLTASFTDQSTDSDGSIVGWSWNFGDGATSTAQNPTHTYAAAGTYTVSLTVTDDDGATDATSEDITVSTGGGGITLTANGYKVRGRQKADLSWSGASGDNVDVYRDGVLIINTENDGFYTDNINNVGGGSYTYQIFDGNTWSNQATVTF